MPKKSKKKKIQPAPKAKRFSPEQADKFLSVLEATSIPKEQIEFAKALISGNEWISQQLERGLLTIAKRLSEKGYSPQVTFKKCVLLQALGYNTGFFILYAAHQPWKRYIPVI